MNNKISVIIPTLQKKLAVLNKLVETLIEDRSVSEIVIINNKVDTPIKLPVSDKIKVLAPDENCYVNMSWNIGIKNITTDKFVLMNDDMLVCKDFCKLVLETGILDKEDTGVAGIDQKFINEVSNTDMVEMPILEENQKPKIYILDYILGTKHWGIAIFGKVSSYTLLPNDLKIFFGDNILIYMNHLAGRKNYIISNLPINHISSSSSLSPEFKKIRDEDIKNSKKYFFQISKLK